MPSINPTCARPSRSFSQMQRWFTEHAAGATELIDDADKRSDNDKYLDRRYCKVQAYEALDHLLTTALDKSETLKTRVADYHKASPALATGSRAGSRRTPRPNQPFTAHSALVSRPGPL